MVLLDLNNDKTIRNTVEVYYINVYLREFHPTLTLKMYDSIKDKKELLSVECENIGKGITSVYIDYDFRDNSSYEIELLDVDKLIYRGQISTGKDFITVDTADRNLIKY